MTVTEAQLLGCKVVRVPCSTYRFLLPNETPIRDSEVYVFRDALTVYGPLRVCSLLSYGVIARWPFESQGTTIMFRDVLLRVEEI